MDFEGQKLAELIFHILIIAFGAVGWVIGYIQQDFTVVFQAWLVGLVLSIIVRYFKLQRKRVQGIFFGTIWVLTLAFAFFYRVDRFAFRIGPGTTENPSNGWIPCRRNEPLLPLKHPKFVGIMQPTAVG